MAANYPTDADLIRFLYGAGQIDSATAPTGRGAATVLNYPAAANAARAEFEKRTGRVYRAQAATQTYDTPTDAAGLLDLRGDWTTITGITRDGDTLDEGDDYRLRPLEGPPYRFVEFVAIVTEPLVWGSRGTLVVTGTRGSAATVPDDVYQAVLGKAALLLAPQLHGQLTQGAQSIKQEDASITFAGNTALGASGAQWAADFEQCVEDYQTGGLIY
jgi:hypothetical protein